jgi:carbon storage regulator
LQQLIQLTPRRPQFGPLRVIVKKEVRVLVLTRKMDERIVIQLDDRDVIVQVVAIDRDRVRLGIIAPPEVPIHREEVLRRIEAADQTLAEVGC